MSHWHPQKAMIWALQAHRPAYLCYFEQILWVTDNQSHPPFKKGVRREKCHGPNIDFSYTSLLLPPITCRFDNQPRSPRLYIPGQCGVGLDHLLLGGLLLLGLQGLWEKKKVCPGSSDQDWQPPWKAQASRQWPIIGKAERANPVPCLSTSGPCVYSVEGVKREVKDVSASVFE